MLVVLLAATKSSTLQPQHVEMVALHATMLSVTQLLHKAGTTKHPDMLSHRSAATQARVAQNCEAPCSHCS